jgi:hypothetical protein
MSPRSVFWKDHDAYVGCISVSGVFHSVREDFGTGQTQWTIAVIPKIQATYTSKLRKRTA